MELVIQLLNVCNKEELCLEIVPQDLEFVATFCKDQQSCIIREK